MKYLLVMIPLQRMRRIINATKGTENYVRARDIIMGC